jgi:hypothetical protein
MCLGEKSLISAPVYMLNCGFLLPDIVTSQLTYGAVILSFLGKQASIKKVIIAGTVPFVLLVQF